jgi:hypothetical protein
MLPLQAADNMHAFPPTDPGMQRYTGYRIGSAAPETQAMERP